MFDLIIRGGTIVDGTGADRFTGDIAIRDGQIAKLGVVAGSAREEIDARGRLVTPGWVDVHTHYDGQATWDPLLMPSSQHGTTTVLMGNCGVGFAPCRAVESERELLIRVMEDVEDIPGSALSEGISWQWETFSEYLDALEGQSRVIDVGTQIPHSAVRCYVMGQRGVLNEAATASDIAAMADMVREGLAAGAFGFSTSRTVLHRTRDGDVLPGTYADGAELLGIGRALREFPNANYQLVSDLGDWNKEMEWMKNLSADSDVAVHFVLFPRKEEDLSSIYEQLRYVDQANRDGARLIPHVAARPTNLLLGWDGTANPFLMYPSFMAIMSLSHRQKMEKLREPDFKSQLLGEQPIHTGNELVDRLATDFDHFYTIGDSPDYEPDPGRSIGRIARATNRDPRDIAYDAMMAGDGKSLIYYPLFGYWSGDLSHQVSWLKDENTVLSLSDSGAHCRVLCDASMPTQMLSYFVRDRTRGERLELEWVVEQLTKNPAMAYGLTDRGTLEVGKLADINIIDLDELQIAAPQVVFDLPAGGGRILQSATGYVATIKRGKVTFRDGKHTGEMPGKLVRRSDGYSLDNKFPGFATVEVSMAETL